MAVTQDIWRSYRAPRAVLRRHLALGPREDRALAYLMLGCLLVFVAQWPRLARTAELDGVGLDRLVAYEFLAWLMIWPLGFYVLAFLGQMAARLAGRPVSGPDSRLVLFWSWLAAAPLGLAYGLATGFVGPGPATSGLGGLWLAAAMWFWVNGLIEAGRGG
jgi:hypothetical protein